MVVAVKRIEQQVMKEENKVIVEKVVKEEKVEEHAGEGKEEGK